MKSDRELLELAAKATGACIREVGERGIRADEWVRQSDGTLLAPTRHGHAPWNPLTDDGDALRLAVKLHFYAKHFPFIEDDGEVYPGFVEVWRIDEENPRAMEYLTAESDRLEVTRLLFVRAAAAIGEQQ